MRRAPWRAPLVALLATLAWTPVRADTTTPIVVNQGLAWNALTRQAFYDTDQGSRMMPLAWMNALRFEGRPFLDGELGRYGYLHNDRPVRPGLPVGFTVTKTPDGDDVGMTCAACHTRQITALGKSYRIDGGPALVDFQAFLRDLDVAMGAVANDAPTFEAFATDVTGRAPSDAERTRLKADVDAWYLRYHVLVDKALPRGEPWGVGRLDAITMIFNRLNGLDLGPPPSRVIASNIYAADAPVRYPFLWNAGRQDRTQWPGFADNGNQVLGLARNIGEVFGVFAQFHPQRSSPDSPNVDYLADNSANFAGLNRLELLIRTIRTPKWPFPIDTALRDRGRAIFAKTCAQGCHEKVTVIEPLKLPVWKTPVLDVGTDRREWDILERKVDPGVLRGAQVFGLAPPLADVEDPMHVLSLAVVGTIVQRTLRPPPLTGPVLQLPQTSVLKGQLDTLRMAFRHDKDAAPYGSYEARVLEGIWAAAPYLHNGSVPSLWELLKPPAERATTFAVGPNYDLLNVGVSPAQPGLAQVRTTTSHEDLKSGNSHGGHDYGTTLSDKDKTALIEYLKTL